MTSRYRLPSEEDDVFNFLPPDNHTPRGTKRQRLDSDDDDDVFFRPRARLGSDTVFPKARLPSDSDSSGVCLHQRRPLGFGRWSCATQSPWNSSSLLLSSAHYTDDTPESSFKTPSSRPPRRKSSDVSNWHSNSTRFTSEGSIWPSFKEPPRVTRAPVSWVSPNVSSVSPLPMSGEGIFDIKQRLIQQLSTSACVTPAGISNFSHGRTSTPVFASPMTSTRADLFAPNLAQSILSEEMHPDSGISSLPTFDGKTSFGNYQKDFEKKLLGVMVGILDQVNPVTSDQQSANVLVGTDLSHPEKSQLSQILSMAATPSSSPGLTISLSEADDSPFHYPDAFDCATPNVSLEQSVPPANPRQKQCNVCHKMLYSSSGLKVHMRIHTGERPFVCPYCFRDFRDKSSFRRHETLHTGKPYSCADCPKSFVRSSEYKRHRLRHHGN